MKNNKGAYQLADDIDDCLILVLNPNELTIELLSNERVALRTYCPAIIQIFGTSTYTASIEVPVKLTDKFTVFPNGLGIITNAV
jgi:hypothetical protein